jgi:hypothetical protein
MAADTSSLLDQLLGKVDESTEAKILRIVNAFGLERNDPLFLLLLANSTVQVLLEQSPHQLQHTLEYANQRALDKIEGYEQAAKRGIERQVAEAVNGLVKKTGASKAQVTAKSSDQCRCDRVGIDSQWVSLGGGAIPNGDSPPLPKTRQDPDSSPWMRPKPWTGHSVQRVNTPATW